MNLNPKFFLITIIFSVAAGFASHISYWLMLLYDYPPSSVGWLNLVVVGPTGLIVGVVLPFIALYLMSRDVQPLSMYKSIIFSTFVGCWGGQVTAFFVNAYIMYINGVTYSDSWLVPFWYVWEFFVLALSSVFFVCLGGILFAYYEKTIDKIEATTYEASR